MSEYNIPVLVKWFDKKPEMIQDSMMEYMGQVIHCMRDSVGELNGPEHDTWWWHSSCIIPNPTPSQIKEEASKAGKKPMNPESLPKPPKPPKPTICEKALAAAKEKVRKAQEHEAGIKRIMELDAALKANKADRAKLVKERADLAKKHLKGAKHGK